MYVRTRKACKSGRYDIINDPNIGYAHSACKSHAVRAMQMHPVNFCYRMHGKRNQLNFFLFSEFYKTDDAQAYFVDQWDLDALVNFRNSL